jgi:hypothetical protein
VRLALVEALALLVLPAPAWAQYGGNTLTLSATTLSPGQQFTASGAGFAANTQVTITLQSQPVTLATVVANAQGQFTVTLTIPAGTTPGTHTVIATGQAPDGSARTLSQTVNVVAQAGGPGTTAVIPGQQVIVSGTGFAPNSTVVISPASSPTTVLATVTTDASGSFSVPVTIPAGTSPGSLTLRATGVAPDGVARTVTQTVNVAAPGTPPLVRTGGSRTSTFINWASVLIAVGFVVIVGVRRTYLRTR